jgi:vitamin B12 transporter
MHSLCSFISAVGRRSLAPSSRHRICERAFRSFARAVVVIQLICLVSYANADTEAPEQITVLATRTDTPVDIAPAPVEIIDTQAIDARQSGIPADLLRGAPGFSVSRSGGIGAVTEVRLRGAEANHLLVLVDGIDINDPALGSSVDFANLDLIGMTRIEILPGAQSALWGSDALAGVMNFETTPAPGATERNVWFEGGSNDTTRESLRLADRNDAWYYALDARHTETAGTNIATSGGEDDGYRNTTLHLNSAYTGERGSVQLVARSVNAQSEYDPTPFPDFVPVDGNLELNVHQRLLGLFGSFNQTDHLTQRLTYRHYDSRNDNLTDGTRDSSSDGDKNQITYQGDYAFAWGATSQLVTWAYEYTREGFNQRGTASAFGDPNQDQHMDTQSAIGEWVVDWNGVSASLSARHDDNSDFDDANDYRVAVRVPIVRPGTTLFLSAGTGTKNPTFVERFGFTPDTFIGNPNLRPERSRSASVAIDQALGERASMRLSYFHDKLEDEINGFFFDANAGGFTAINTDGDSHREGVEFTITAHVLESLQARLDYTYLDATQPGAVHQEDELRRPHNTGRVVLDYTPLPDRLTVELGAAYVGTHDDDDFATFPARRVSLDGYTLVHCTARYRISDRIELTGRIENATDEHYQDVFGYATPGRQGYVGINVRL